MLVRMLLALVLLASSAQAGSFNVIESDGEQTPRTERTYTAETAVSPVQVDAAETRTTLLDFGMARMEWSAQVRAFGRASCYVVLSLLNADGSRVEWDNAIIPIPRNSNGFATARGSIYGSQRVFSNVVSTQTEARCN